MRKLRIANVAVLFIMILVMVLVDCEMVKPTHTTNFKFRLKSQSVEPVSIHTRLARKLESVDYVVLPGNYLGILASSSVSSL